MKVDYQSKKSAKSLQNVKNSLQKVCKKSAKRQKKSAKSALTADFADSRRLLKKSARFCPPMSGVTVATALTPRCSYCRPTGPHGPVLLTLHRFELREPFLNTVMTCPPCLSASSELLWSVELRVNTNHTFPGAIRPASLPCSSGEEQRRTNIGRVDGSA